MQCKDYLLSSFLLYADITQTAVTSWIKQYSDIEVNLEKIFEHTPNSSTTTNWDQKIFLLAITEVPWGPKALEETLAWFYEHKVDSTPSKLKLPFKDLNLSPNTNPSLIQKFGILIMENQ